MFNFFIVRYDDVFNFITEKKKRELLSHKLLKYSVDITEMFRFMFLTFYDALWYIVATLSRKLSRKSVILTPCLQSNFSFPAGC